MSREQAQKLADNVYLVLLSRVAMFVTPLLMSGAIAFAAGLASEVRALQLQLAEFRGATNTERQIDIGQVNALGTEVRAIDRRVTSIETRRFPP